MASNLPTVTIEEFTSIVKLQFQEGIKRPIFGLGKGGIGKTESIGALAKELGIGYIDIRLLLYSEVDLKGIPYPNVGHTATVWLQNDILPRVDRDGEKGILVLDEITSVARSVRTAAYQLLNERKLGEYSLPDGWLIVCLGNGEEDGGDFEGMEGNFANRCSMYNVAPNAEAWKRWAFNNNVNYLVTAYISWRPGDLHTYNPESETDMLFASPRSWKAVSDILNAHPFNKDDNLNNIRIVGNLGQTVGNMFIAFCKYRDNNIEPMDVLTGKCQDAKMPTIEVMFLTVQGVIKLLTDMTNKELENGCALTNRTVDYWANSIRWMLKLSALEYRVMALKDLVASNLAISTKLFLNQAFREKCPELAQFITSNKEVFRQ